MRVRVSLDFDILIESFISLCIIETVGAIFREYKPWIVLSITQWSKSPKILKIKSFKEEGYDIVYMDEAWVNQNHCTDYMWLPNDGSDAPKISSGKGKRLNVLHAFFGISSRKRNVVLCKIVLENSFFLTKIHRIFCFNTSKVGFFRNPRSTLNLTR
jgi:hypothetical protein